MRPGHSNMQSRFGCNLAALRPKDSIESGNLGVEKIKTNLPFAPASLLIPAEKWLPGIQTQRERERERKRTDANCCSFGSGSCSTTSCRRPNPMWLTSVRLQLCLWLLGILGILGILFLAFSSFLYFGMRLRLVF